MPYKTEKDYNKKMNDNKDMPKIVEIKNEEGIKKWGGKTMVIAPPLDYDKYMKQVPYGKVVTLNEIRKELASNYKVEITCPLTAGIFSNICAWASSQRENDITPYWRTLKANGELNSKYPGGLEEQKALLEKEGHKIISKGRTTKKYFVEDFEKSLYKFD